jgi:hypothetical protein
LLTAPANLWAAQKVTQLQASLVKLRLWGADRATQVPGDFAVRQTFHVVQQENCAIAVRQPPEGAPNGNPIDSPDELLVLNRKKIQKRGFSTLGARTQLNRHGAMTVGAQTHQNHIYGQTVQPRRQRCVPTEGGELQKTLQKRFLGAIFRFWWFPSDAQADWVHLASVRLI